jgi:asparagine synthase (glutamine-hydrolysing)
MAHSVEGRFPFLDYRVVEFCCALPPSLRLFGLNEKYLLRRIASQWLPAEIWTRRKRPYRAPIHRSFIRPEGTPEWVEELLSPSCLEAAGLFHPSGVRQLVVKLQAGKRIGETDDMALAGILSAQLVWREFVDDFARRLPPPALGELTRDITPTPGVNT